MSRSDDIWAAFVAAYAVGDRLDATVVKTVPFGALVEVAGGIPGLLVAGGVYAEDGETVAVRIKEIDSVKRRLALQPA